MATKGWVRKTGSAIRDLGYTKEGVTMEINTFKRRIEVIQDYVDREMEFSPKCPSCNDDRFYYVMRAVSEKIASLLKAIDKAGNIQEDTF